MEKFDGKKLVVATGDIMANQGDCAVCCDPFNRSTRKRVDCGRCEFAACTSCVQRFMLDLTDVSQCMNCKHPWDREFLESKFTKKFINGDLKIHRENVLYEIEKGLLPETQPFAEFAKVELQLKEFRKPFNAQLKKAKEQLKTLDEETVFHTVDSLKKLKEIKINIHTLKEELAFLVQAALLTRIDGEGSHAVDLKERRDFIKPCPAADCRGFLSTGWKCGLCAVKVCAKCHEVKATPDADEGEQHICKAENLATVEALAKDSKACPKCGSMIQRIEGCSQMFHTPLSGGCGAVFDWNTLRLHAGSDGTIHNPHWYEYQRHMNGGIAPRNLADVPCGGMPPVRVLTQTLNNLCGALNPYQTQVYQIHQGYNHNQYQELPHFQVNAITDNRDLRISYLLQRIDEAKFKQQLQMREKAREKKLVIGQILRMYQTAVMDIMGRLSATTKVDQVPEVIHEVDGLVTYTNENFEKAANVFDCVKPRIDPVTFKFTTRAPPKPKP